MRRSAKNPKGNCLGPKEDPVVERTRDSTEAEEHPVANRKTKNMWDRQRRGKKPHRRTTTGKPGRSAT